MPIRAACHGTEGDDATPKVAIALDGDKIKPNPGGNGFGVNEEGAGYTLTGVDRHGVAYECACLNPGHPQTHRVYTADGAFPTLQAVAGALAAEPGMKQQTYAVYKLDSLASNSMKSANPHSGIHEEQVAACLDATTPDPTKNQGGNVIVSTNSNGEDVAPCFNTSLAKHGGDNQTTFNGGYVVSRAVGFKAGQSKDGGLGDEPEVSPTLSHQPSALEPTVAIEKGDGLG